MSGSTVALQRTKDEQKTNNERCKPHGQIMKRRTKDEGMLKRRGR